MVKKNRILTSFLLTMILLPLSVIPAYSGDLPSSGNYQGQAGKICVVYITGIGCPNCSVTDPLLFSKFLKEYPNLIIIEYEVYQDRTSNMDIFERYFRNYLPRTSPRVPLLLFDKNKSLVGKINIVDSEATMKNLSSNECPLIQGAISFEDLHLALLPGKPKIWTRNRILISQPAGGRALHQAVQGRDDSALLRKLLLSQDLSSALKGVTFEQVEARPVPISKDIIEFDKAVKIGNWILQWREEKVTEGLVSGSKKQKKEQRKSKWRNIFKKNKK